MTDDNNSTRKLAIEEFVKDDGTLWIRVLLLKYGEPRHGAVPQFIPSLLDLYRILQAMAKCEDLKYPKPHQLGRYKLLNFLIDTIKNRDDWATLAKRYQIPERDGDVVINTNGASLNEKPAGVLVSSDEIEWGSR